MFNYIEISPYSPWWQGLICLYGRENVHWEYLETDAEWWELHIIANNMQN